MIFLFCLVFMMACGYTSFSGALILKVFFLPMSLFVSFQPKGTKTLDFLLNKLFTEMFLFFFKIQPSFEFTGIISNDLKLQNK